MSWKVETGVVADMSHFFHGKFLFYVEFVLNFETEKTVINGYSFKIN